MNLSLSKRTTSRDHEGMIWSWLGHVIQTNEQLKQTICLHCSLQWKDVSKMVRWWINKNTENYRRTFSITVILTFKWTLLGIVKLSSSKASNSTHLLHLDGGLACQICTTRIFTITLMTKRRPYPVIYGDKRQLYRRQMRNKLVILADSLI